MGCKPTRFWEARGYGFHKEHSINAYDLALRAAGICQQNILTVSSIPPAEQITPIVKKGMTYVPFPNKPWVLFPNIEYHKTKKIKETDYLVLDRSWVIDCVQARSDGVAGDRITSSIGIIWVDDPDGLLGAYVVENHGHKTIESSVDCCIEMLRHMVKCRDEIAFEIEDREPKFTTESIHLCNARNILSKGTRELTVDKIIGEWFKPRMKIYTISVNEIPEGLLGCVLATVVFDPFTEIHS